jgi:hypothetical protein
MNHGILYRLEKEGIPVFMTSWVNLGICLREINQTQKKSNTA